VQLSLSDRLYLPALDRYNFLGWRVYYEVAAYALALATDAPPALWSGPRRHQFKPIAPLRPRTAGMSKPVSGEKAKRHL
jgi:hypothetical protein